MWYMLTVAVWDVVCPENGQIVSSRVHLRPAQCVTLVCRRGFVIICARIFALFRAQLSVVGIYKDAVTVSFSAKCHQSTHACCWMAPLEQTALVICNRRICVSWLASLMSRVRHGNTPSAHAFMPVYLRETTFGLKYAIHFLHTPEGLTSLL